MAERGSIRTLGLSVDSLTAGLLQEVARRRGKPLSSIVEDALWAYRPIKNLADTYGIEKPAPRKRGRPRKESVSAPA